MKVVGLARVSSKEQESGYSLDAQVKLNKEYAGGKDFTIVKTFRITESASGKQIRKIFNEMLNFATDHNIPVIICEKIDRLTRNLKDANTVNEWVREDKKREVHFIKENFILNSNTRAHENLVWDMKVAIARFYSNNLSEEIRKGQKEKIAQGGFPTKAKPGYKGVGEKGHKVDVIDEAVAPYIIQMFERYATGNYSLKALVKVMYEEGLRNRSGKKIGKTRMHQLLADPFYYGKLRWKGEIYQGNHQPIISKELFDAVQIKLDRNLSNPQYRKHLPIFKAKIKCEECGGLITWELQKGHWYGHCNHYRDCGQKAYTRQEKVEEQLFPYFDKVAPKSDRVLNWLERALKESHKDKIQYHTAQREKLNTQIATIDQRMEGAYEDKLDKRITAEKYDERSRKWQEDKADLLKSLHNLSDANQQYYQVGFAIHELALKAKAIYHSQQATTDDKRLLLSKLFADMSLDEGKLTGNYSAAFEFLITWIPKVNKIFEPELKVASNKALATSTAKELQKAMAGVADQRQDFRTDKNKSVEPQKVLSDAETNVLFPGRDSNPDSELQRLLSCR